MKNDIDFIWRGKKHTFLGLPWTFTTYYLTKTKFITRSGFIAVDEDEIDLYKITDKKVKFPFWQRLVGCGSIVIYSKDIDTPVKEVRCIKNARKVSALIDKYLNEMRDKYRIRGKDMMGFAHDGCDCCDDNDDMI